LIVRGENRSHDWLSSVLCPSSSDMDKIKLTLAFLCVVAGIAGYYYFADTAQVLRVLMVMAGLLAAGGVAWLSEPGKEFFAFSREAWAEAGRVAWPTRKETMQTTAVVFGFVVLTAAVLAGIDGVLSVLTKLILG
jgi:preprotein translocase subunit SecE